MESASSGGGGGGGCSSRSIVEAEEEEKVKKKIIIRRYVKNQIPDSILNDPSLNSSISLLPSNYNFEIHKCVWRVLSTGAKRVALQLPEGLLMYSLILSDIFSTHAHVSHCFVLGDVTYGACCIDDLSALALSADLLIHYGHSCLLPIDNTSIPCLYVFVDIHIDVPRLVNSILLSFPLSHPSLVLAGTIQFASAIRQAKPLLESHGFRVSVPQSRPLSAGEVLGCTAPKVPLPHDENDDTLPGETIAIFVADGRFHLEAFMIANPTIKAFRYDPYMGKLFLEEYDHQGMRNNRRCAIQRARNAATWGLVLGTLGRQGNPRILDRLEKKMRDRGLNYTVFLMSEISPVRIALFEDTVDAWVQIACPRLSIDWGDAFQKPLLTPFEAEIALGDYPGWWERSVDVVSNNSGCGCCGIKTDDCDDVGAASSSCSGCGCSSSTSNSNNNGVVSKGSKGDDLVGDYPMDYYAQDGGDWNSSYAKKKMTPRPLRRSAGGVSSSVGNVAAS